MGYSYGLHNDTLQSGSFVNSHVTALMNGIGIDLWEILEGERVRYGRDRRHGKGGDGSGLLLS